MTCQPPSIVCFPIAPIPPPPIVPFPGLRGPIIGDTSGNAAAPGNVGEFIQRSVSGTLTVNATSNLVTTVTPLQLGPGDWDLEAWLSISMLFNGASFYLNPSVPGTSDSLASACWLPGAVNPQFNKVTLQSPRVQLLQAQAATILQFDINVVNTGNNPQTGPYFFTVNARRMR